MCVWSATCLCYFSEDIRACEYNGGFYFETYLTLRGDSMMKCNIHHISYTTIVCFVNDNSAEFKIICNSEKAGLFLVILN